MSKFTAFHVSAVLQVPPGSNEEPARRLLEKAEEGCLITNSFSGSVHLIPGWVQTTFNARDVEFANPLLLTNPPKKQLAFTLGDTRYIALIAMDDEGWRLVPVE